MKQLTSALDSESEKIVQATLDKLLLDVNSSITTIIVAHKLATIQYADRIAYKMGVLMN